MSDVCKKLFPHQDLDSLNKFYGDPRGRNGTYSPSWYKENIVRWIPPYQMYYSVDHSKFSHMMVHKKCLSVFQAAYTDVFKHFGQQKITQLRLDISGGSYCYRLERGGSDLSVHSWGCAIDMDPVHNPFPQPWKKGGIDPTFCQIMESHGFWWRGENGDVDPMHFQCCYRND
jgi:D-alanyl-D-alanine carboxypeptidase